MSTKGYGWFGGPGALRLLLSFLVVAHHSTALALGKFAVFAFFILSGYWVTKAYSEKYVSEITLGNILRFYALRYWRLMPLFVVTTGLALLVFRFSGLPTPTDPWRQFALPGLNVVGAGVLSPAWSLDVEMQFYLLLPLLVAFAPMRWLAAIAPLMVLAVSLIHPLPETFFTYLAFFVAGMAIYRHEWRPGPNLLWPSIALTAILAVLKVSLFWDTYQAMDVIVTIAFIPAIAANVHTRGLHDKMLGDLSYSLYLFHWLPVFYLRHYIGFYRGHEWSTADTLPVLLAWAVSFAGAIVLLIVVDLPSERLRRYSGRVFNRGAQHEAVR